MFRYMADAAVFRDCRSGKRFPVSMEGAYIELERAYLNSGIQAGEEVLVKLRGRYLERPAMEGNHNEVKLIVDTLENLDSQDSCTPTHHAELQNTYWKLLELDGQPVVTPEGMREANLILTSDGSRAHGHAGCNNFFGTFLLADDTLSFSALGSTMMACPEGMDSEQAFLNVLGETTRYEISGQFLTLFADDHPLARLEAVYL
jgi:copper homeostasis protein (lipoprotein)